MKKRLICILALVILVTSCQPILNLYMGVKKPKIENEKSLTKYLEKKGLRTDNLYALDITDYQYLDSIVDGVPDIMIFSSDGRLIKYKPDTSCNASAFSFLETVKPNMKFDYINCVSFDDCFSRLKDLKGNPVVIKKSENIDFYLIIFWARFIGRLNKDHVKIWEEQALNNTNAKIKVFKVNKDMQEWWDDNNTKNKQ